MGKELFDLFQHGVHGGTQGVGPCGWYSASAAPAPTAPARLKRAQLPHQLPVSNKCILFN